MPSAGSAGDDDSSPTTAPRRAPEKAADYVVQPGDNLWRIAERHLATLTGQPAADLAIAEVRSYWARLVDHTQTTTGRRTGRPHCIEIWYAADRNTLYLLAGGGTSSDWVRNLCADPNVLVEVGGDIRPGRARVLGTGDEADTARALVFGKYAPRYRGDLTGWRQSALPIAVDLGNS